MTASSVDEVLSLHKSSCSNAIESFKRDLQKVRTGRASTGILEGIVAECYGSKTAISHLGQISAPEVNTLLIQVYDAGTVSAVEKAIQGAGLGFNPSTEGTTIRISVPPLTEERRKRAS